MAVVQGIKEKVHLPIYDSIIVKSGEQLGKEQKSSTLKFFVDVQGKTKLETNLQSAALLPHYNTFEARAMRVVISDLPPDFPEDVDVTIEDLPVEDAKKADGTAVANVTAKLETNLQRAMKLLREALDDTANRETTIELPDDEVTPSDATVKQGSINLTVADLEGAIEDLDRDAPAPEQVRPNDGAGTIVGRLVYNTVTTFYVGEKIMIQMPTWFFPAGAGPYSEAAKFTTHGEPSPTATFRFAEPIFIDKQQNFRVEIEIPDAEVLKDIQKIYGPLFIWVVLDGYMTRDVQ